MTDHNDTKSPPGGKVLGWDNAMNVVWLDAKDVIWEEVKRLERERCQR